MAEAIITEVYVPKISGTQLTKIISENDITQYTKNQAYYEGKNPTIVGKAAAGRPDHRVPLPFGRRTVNDVTGYAYKPGNVRYVFDEDQPEASVDKINEIFDYNLEPLTSCEIFIDSLIKGEGAELHFVADNIPQFVQIPREQCIFVFRDVVKETLDYSIRLYTTKTFDEKGELYSIDHAEVYHSDRIDYYESSKQTQSSINQQSETQGTLSNTYTAYKFIKSEQHFYGSVPLFPYRIGPDKLGVFQAAISIIDILDNFGSDSIANSIDRFNETLLLLSKKLDNETAEKIKEYNIFDDLGPKGEGHFVEFLNRQMDITSTVEGFKIFERLYYELTGVPNMHDDKFRSQSGIAILYSLVPFENLVAQYENYFSIGLKHRLELLNTICGIMYGSNPVKCTLKWDRNLPTDLQSIINEVVALKNAGVVTDETLLNMLPRSVIPDVQMELEKLDKQKQKNMDMFESRLTEPTEDEDITDDEAAGLEENL